MGYYEGLNPLRDVLADLYWREGSALTMATEAGIAAQLVDYDGSALEFWQSILTVAQNSGKVQSLIDVAMDQYSTNPNLIAAIDHYEASSEPPLPTAPPAQEPGGGNGSVSINVGGESNGIIAGRNVTNAQVVNVGDVGGDNNAIGIGNSVTIGGIPAEDEAPSLDRFQLMIEELQAALEELAAHNDLLGQIAPSAPSTTQGVLANINAVTDDLDNDSDDVNGGNVNRNLTTAGRLLATLNGAINAAQKANDAVDAVSSLAGKMAPIVAKIGLAATWALELWPAAV